MVAAVTDSEFQSKVLGSKKPVLVDFWAAWCGPCRALSPIVDELAKEMGDKVDFYKLNIDENAEVTMQYKIRGVPTLLLFKNGALVDQLVGAVPKSQLHSFVSKAL